MSTSTGRYPACTIAATAPENVRLGVSTGAPGSSRSARRLSSIAWVQEATVTTCGWPRYADSSASNAAHSGPVVTQPESSTRSAASRAPAANGGTVKATAPAVETVFVTAVIGVPPGARRRR